MKDQEFIELLKKRDYKIAGEKLFRYFPVVRKHVLNNSGTKQEAEDLYQEAIILLIRKIDQGDFELTSSLETYLFSVCRYLWMDQLKLKAKYNAAIRLAADETAPDAPFKEEEKYKLAEQALQTLGEACKKLLRLFYLDKKNFNEIAVLMKFSTERVAKNQKYRCLEKARDNFKQLNTL